MHVFGRGGAGVITNGPTFHLVSMTQPLSGESSVLVTDLISDGFFLISTKGKLPVEQGKSCKKLKRAAQNRRHLPPGYRGRIDYEHEQGVDRGGSNAGFAIGSAK